MPAVEQETATAVSDRPKRRLKPEVAARLAARSKAERVQKLYSRPPEDLAPEELALMKAWFFRG